jgi:hypothetical protein
MPGARTGPVSFRGRGPRGVRCCGNCLPAGAGLLTWWRRRDVERIRISYWIASGRRIIALTVFAKTRMRETAEIARAAAAMAHCQQEGHTAEEEG